MHITAKLPMMFLALGLAACTQLSDQDRATLTAASQNADAAKQQSAQALSTAQQALQAAQQAQAAAQKAQDAAAAAAADAKTAQEKADRIFQRSLRK
jgi:hypothetical protein